MKENNGEIASCRSYGCLSVNTFFVGCLIFWEMQAHLLLILYTDYCPAKQTYFMAKKARSKKNIRACPIQSFLIALNSPELLRRLFVDQLFLFKLAGLPDPVNSLIILPASHIFIRVMTRKYLKVKVGRSKYMLSFKDLKQLVSRNKLTTPLIPQFERASSKSEKNSIENLSTKIFQPLSDYF